MDSGSFHVSKFVNFVNIIKKRNQLIKMTNIHRLHAESVLTFFLLHCLIKKGENLCMKWRLSALCNARNRFPILVDCLIY